MRGSRHVPDDAVDLPSGVARDGYLRVDLLSLSEALGRDLVRPRKEQGEWEAYSE